MRIVFAGNPAIAIPALEEIFRLSCNSSDKKQAPVSLAAVLTNPDSPKGRSGVLAPTEIGEAALRLSAEYKMAGIPAPLVLKPEKHDADARSQIASLEPDLLVSFAYGRIFGPKFLALFPLGGINIHPSLLPKFRGPTPIPAAILSGESETGISIQRLAAKMDCGDILIQEHIALSGRETCSGLGMLVAKKAAELLPLVLEGIVSCTLQSTPQNDEQAVYCPLISKEEGLIDWNKSAGEIDALIRAYDSWPQTWTMHTDRQLFILRAVPVPDSISQTGTEPGLVLGIDKSSGILIQTGEGILAVSELQYRSKKAMNWKDFINGARDFLGCRLGQN